MTEAERRVERTETLLKESEQLRQLLTRAVDRLDVFVHELRDEVARQAGGGHP